MQRQLLVLCSLFAISACKVAPDKLARPSETTAFVVVTDYMNSASLLAVDLATHKVDTIVPPAALAIDSSIKVFEKNLYVVSRSYDGKDNSIVVLDPDNGYKPKCGGDFTACNFPLGEKFNTQDFWVVNAHKAYFAPGITYGAPASRYIYVIDPLSGTELNKIDVIAGAAALDVHLDQINGDQDIDFGSMTVVGHRLFVILKMLKTQSSAFGDAGFPQPVDAGCVAPASGVNTCQYVPARVLVIDLDTDKVEKIITLQGSNPAGDFVREPGTNNLLVSTQGPLDTFSINAHHGIERIDAELLAYNGMAATEEQMNGTVFNFGIDSKGNGLAFTGRGDYNNPDYSLVRFKNDKGFVAAVQNEGVKGLTTYGFISVNDRDQAYVSLPYSMPRAPLLGTYNVATGEMVSGNDITLDRGAQGIAFYPGDYFIK